MKRNTPKAIAAQTGGEYETFETLNAFENHMIDFTNHLHSRYLLSFQPQESGAGLAPDYGAVGDGQHRAGQGKFGRSATLTMKTYGRKRWHSRISPRPGAAITFNIAVTEGIAGGTRCW